MPDLWWLLEPPYIYLILGITFLSAAVASTYTGKTYARFGFSASRAEKPKDFWGAVAIYYLSGVLFIGYFFYEVHQLSN